MFFELVYDKSLAQASYVIGCQAGGVAAVIDPKRDVDTYLRIAEANNLKITHILETHIHADFLCGSRELAALTGAELYLSDEGDEHWKYDFPNNKLKHGDTITVGNLTFDVLHTPGHTPEHISFLLTDPLATTDPVMLFTGDFVFVGDVGRPDLLEQAAGMKGTQEIGAEQLFESLTDFMKLEDYIQIWPGHGAGSACGKSLGAVPMSTVGYEKLRNWALKLLNDKKAFTKELLSGQPEPPKYFAMMKKLNKVERNLVTAVPTIKKLDRTAFENAKDQGIQVIDTRTPSEFANGFMEGTYNIPNTQTFSTWMGWFMAYGTPFVLIAAENQAEDLSRKLMRIGMDDAFGFITPEQLHDFSDGQLLSYSPISKEAVSNLIDSADIQIIDVRNQSEFKGGHIEGADNLYIGTLPDNLNKVSREKRVIVHCQSGARAAIAYSILRAKGFHNVENFAGGWASWSKSKELSV
nr:MBL fold metallo-hydrolase [Cytophagales bacterium]